MNTFEAFALGTLRDQQAASGRAYLEFLRRPDLSVGLYRLPRGGEDAQRPHTEDEIYFVAAGQSRFRAGDEDRAVAPGDVLFVAAGVPHRFHSIEQDLELIVIFGPAEGSRA